MVRQIENKSEGARHQPWARWAADFMLLTSSYLGIARGVGGGEHSHGADEEEDEFGHDAVERGSNGVEMREGTEGRGWEVMRVRKRRRGAIESGGDGGASPDGRAGRRAERREAGPRWPQSLGWIFGRETMRGSAFGRRETAARHRAWRRGVCAWENVGKRGEQREGRGAWNVGVVKTAWRVVGPRTFVWCVWMRFS